MTKFNKKNFRYDGGYLMYTGEYEGRPRYKAGPMVHPSNVGRGIDLFIARFKYRTITKGKFLKALFKSGMTVEQYAEAVKDNPPFAILREYLEEK